MDVYQGGIFVIKVLVCDDDRIITDKVQQLLTIIQEQYIFELDIETYNDGRLAMESKEIYDIAIVDIEMPDVDGLALSEDLKKRNSDAIVMILTSFSDYLDSAMRIQVFRYLSKPIDEERFTKNFMEAVDYYKQISKQIVVESGDEVLTIKTKDILYIENLKHGSVIATKHGDYKTNKKPLEWYETINQPNCFTFSHKSFLVNLQNVINFDKNTVHFQGLNNTVRIACISQRKYYEFKKAFFDFAGGVR